MEKQRKLEKHPNGQYRVRIRKNGVTKSFFLGRSKKAARAKLKQIEEDIASGVITFGAEKVSDIDSINGKSILTVTELADRHFEWVQANRAKRTFELRQRCVRRFLEHVGPSCLVSDLTRIQMEGFYIAMRARHSGANCGNHDLVQVKTMLKWGEEMELIDLPFRKFPVVQHTPPETKRLQPAELAALMEKLPDDFRAMITFGLITGLRPKELRELSFEQIHSSPNGQRYILIEGHKTVRQMSQPKPRTVPLCSLAVEILERQKKRRSRSKVVFLNADGRPYERTAFRNRLIRWCKRAGIPEATPYALRHTFASMQSDAGTETTALARLMGHSQTRTLERYVSNTLESQLKAVESLGEQVQALVGE